MIEKGVLGKCTFANNSIIHQLMGPLMIIAIFMSKYPRGKPRGIIILKENKNTKRVIKIEPMAEL
jgi:hypothetical protein